MLDFTQVTIGMGRLQQALHEFVHEARPEVPDHAPKILLGAPPGSQHTFGAATVAECFAFEGWDVRYLPGEDWSSWASLLRDERIDVLGLSLSGAAQIEAVTSAIVQLRRASRNPRLRVLIGGPLVREQPSLIGRCGGDAVATSIDDAVELARRWVAEPDARRESSGCG